MSKQLSDSQTSQTSQTHRRDFLKKTASIAGMGMAMGSSLLSAPYVMSNVKEKLVIQTRPARFTKLEQMKNSFIAKYPEAEIEFIALAGVDHEDTISKTLAQIAAGKQIDLQRVATEGVQLYAGAGYIQALDKWVRRDANFMRTYFADVNPAFPHSMMYEGSLYQICTAFNAANIYINKNLFKENDIERPSDNWTKDDFYAIAKKITKKSGGKTDIYGYGWTNRLWGSWMPWIFNNDTNLYTEAEAPPSEFSSWFWNYFYGSSPVASSYGGGPRWETPQANHENVVEALEFMMQMQQEGITPEASLGDGATLTGFYSSNRLGMTPAGGFWAGALKGQGMTPDDFDVCYFPKWKSQRHQFGAEGYLMMDKCQAKDLAWEFIKHTSSYEWQVPFVSGNITTPIRRSLHNDLRYSYTGPDNWRVFYNTVDKLKDTAAIPAPPCSNPMTRAFTKYTGLALTGDLSAKDALNKMQSDLMRIQDKYSPMYKS